MNKKLLEGHVPNWFKGALMETAFRACNKVSMKKHPVNAINPGDRFYKVAVSQPMDSEAGKCIVKMFGMLDKHDKLRLSIIIDYQAGYKTFYTIPKIKKEQFDSFLLDTYASLFDNSEEQQYKVLDLSDIDNLDDQLKKMQDLGAVKV